MLVLDFEYVDVRFNSMAGIPLNPLNPLPRQSDTRSINQGYNWGWGWHAGALVNAGENTRVGASYHSSVEVKLDGRSKFYRTISTCSE